MPLKALILFLVRTFFLCPTVLLLKGYEQDKRNTWSTEDWSDDEPRMGDLNMTQAKTRSLPRVPTRDAPKGPTMAIPSLAMLVCLDLFQSDFSTFRVFCPYPLRSMTNPSSFATLQSEMNCHRGTTWYYFLLESCAFDSISFLQFLKSCVYGCGH